LDKLLSILAKEEKETRADAEDNTKANISIANEAYDADSDTDSEPIIKLGFDDY